MVKGIVYYVSIPTMYMLLMIYAILNLHVISWGTREVKKTPAELEEEEKRKVEVELLKMEEEAKNKGIVFDWLENVKNKTSSFMPGKQKWRLGVCFGGLGGCLEVGSLGGCLEV